MDPDLNPIGGFFELEIPAPQKPVHPLGIPLSTGRSCLLAILEFLKPTRCHVPHYTCDATLAPFHQRGIAIDFYELDSDLHPQLTPDLSENECFLVTNYWGLQRERAATLSKRYGRRLIVDDTHDFHSYRAYPDSWSFTSARKYFGVPDGAFLYPPKGVSHFDVVPESTPRFLAISLQHSVNRMLGHQSQAFAEYQTYEASLPSELLRISRYSQSILSLIDINQIFDQRRTNFQFLASALDATNSIDTMLASDASPFVYPYLPEKPIAKLAYYAEKIFVPTYWPDVLKRPSMTCPMARDYARRLIPLPVDHRYGELELQRLIDVTRTLESQA